MIALYCHALAHLGRTLAALPPGVHVLREHAWHQFAQLMPRASGVVVVLPRLSDTVFRRLCRLKGRYPLIPLVLITSKDPDNTRYLKDVMAEEVVWIGDEPRELWPAVQRVSTNGAVRLRLADAIEGAYTIPSKLRKGLAHTCRSDEPIRSIRELARVMRCGASTLTSQWRCALGSDHDTRLEVFVDWLLVLRAMERKTIDRSWETVADEMGMYGSSLGRLARRVTGCTLRELAAGGIATVLPTFEVRVLTQLLGTSSNAVR